MKLLQGKKNIMIKFIKNYGVYIAEIISAILLLVIVYYGLVFFCLINDKCYNYYYGVL